MLIAPKLQFPKQSLAEWGNEFLTSVHIKYKGYDKIVISEPSKMKIDRFFEYLPKKVHEQTTAISEKFVADNRENNPRLVAGNITIKWILLKCNVNLDTRGDIVEHSAHTHGININKLGREASIKVNNTEVLILSKSTNICELPTEKRHQLITSWFNSCAATGTVTDVEG